MAEATKSTCAYQQWPGPSCIRRVKAHGFCGIHLAVWRARQRRMAERESGGRDD